MLHLEQRDCKQKSPKNRSWNSSTRI